MDKLGERIREARQRKGWSQTELARVSGVGRSLIANVEHGRKSMSLKSARAIARALGVSIDFLAGTFEDSGIRAAVA